MAGDLHMDQWRAVCGADCGLPLRGNSDGGK
jgi:hypothetical protein